MQIALLAVFITLAVSFWGWRMIKRMEKQWKIKKSMIMDIFKQKEKISADDVKNIFSVNEDTAKEILIQMEKEGVIKKESNSEYYKKNKAE